GFPIREGAPLVIGYGARPDADSALGAAVREALQQLAFLWGEAIPVAAPAFAPTPVRHLEWFLWPAQHALLPHWLAGGHLRHVQADAPPKRRRRGGEPAANEIRFVDLTPEYFRDRLRVVKAFSSDAAPLAFGDPPFTRHLPVELRVHPVS